LIKSEIIEMLRDELGVTKALAEKAVETFLDIVKENVDGKVVLSGFGTFLLRTRRTRTGRNPKTGEAIKLPEMKTVGFISAKSWKKKVR